MSDLRVMDVSENAVGLGSGIWLRWPELRMYLVELEQKELADDIERQILDGEEIQARVVTVRR